MLTLEGLQQKARKTIENPPRVAVYDMIAVAKGKDNKYASDLYLRYLQEGKVPNCEEVEPDLISSASGSSSGNQDFHHGGSSRKKVRVASAEEMVQILMQLPGETAFKRNCANLVVRYLGGDPSLVDDVAKHRIAQEQMARDDPDNPMRVFGEDVEARGTKRSFDDVEKAIERGIQKGIEGTITLLKEHTTKTLEDLHKALIEKLNETHVWSFSTPGRDKELEEIAKRLEGDELVKFDEDEGIIRPSDFLKKHFSLNIWKVLKNKYNSLFRRKLKEAVKARHRETQRPVYITLNQGALRIVYSLNDLKLMEEVFKTCEESFTRITNRDLQQITRATPGQTLITDFTTPRDDSDTDDDMGDL